MDLFLLLLSPLSYHSIGCDLCGHRGCGLCSPNSTRGSLGMEGSPLAMLQQEGQGHPDRASPAPATAGENGLEEGNGLKGGSAGQGGGLGAASGFLGASAFRPW